MAILFFGSSDFSIPALRACLESPHEVLRVITTPNKKKGRGLKESPTPVRVFAEGKGIPTDVPPSLKSPEILDSIKKLKPDFFVVSSYGKIIPPAFLKIPTQLALNVHPSLLPKYRGASPIQWPILNGEYETGISIAEVTDQLDAGDIFYQQRVPLTAEDDSITLAKKLAGLSYSALAKVFQKIQEGKLGRISQDESLSSYARKLQKGDGLISWNRPAREIHNQVRALLSWPVAHTFFQGQQVQILKTRIENTSAGLKPGQVVSIDRNGVGIQTASGILVLEKVRPAGKKEMAGAEFARGRKLAKGSAFDTGVPSS